MGAIVFASTGGRKYHFNKECKAFHSAQDLSDPGCGCETYCAHPLHVMHSLVRMSATKAAMDGKLPCLRCVPTHLREMPDADDFGHVPHDEYAGSDGPEAHRLVCARCTRWTRWADIGIWVGHRVTWPCTSAVVLGLVPRPPQ